MGATVAARRAGRKLATSETAPSAPASSTNVNGSVALTPNSRLARRQALNDTTSSVRHDAEDYRGLPHHCSEKMHNVLTNKAYGRTTTRTSAARAPGRSRR